MLGGEDMASVESGDMERPRKLYVIIALYIIIEGAVTTSTLYRGMIKNFMEPY